MRKYFLFVLFISGFSVFAQSGYQEWVNKISRDSEIKGIMPYRNHTWLVYGNYDLGSCSGGIIYLLDSNLNEIWTQKTAGIDIVMLDTLDNIFAIGRNREYTDYPEKKNAIIINIFDSGGQLLYASGFDPRTWHFIRKELTPKQIIQYGNNYLTFNDSFIYYFNLSGQILQKQPFQKILNRQQLFWADQHEFIWVKANKLYLSDTLGNLTDSLAFSHQLSTGVWKNNELLIASGSLLYHIDKNLKIKDSFDLSIFYVSEIHRIQEFDNKIYISATGGNIALKYMIFKLSDNHLIEDVHYFPPDQYVPQTFFAVKKHFLITGNNEPWNNMSVSLINTKIFTTFPERPDIKIISVDLSHFRIDQHQLTFDMEFKVVNKGDKAINFFCAYAPLFYGTHCYAHHYYGTFDNQALAKNDTATIKITDIWDVYRDKIQICLRIMNPDQMFEAEISDNSICDSFDITGIEALSNKNEQIFYPNPASDFIRLADKYQAGTVLIYDATGRKIQELRWSDQNTEINISELPNGLYFIKIDNELRKLMITR